MRAGLFRGADIGLTKYSECAMTAAYMCEICAQSLSFR